MVLHKLKNGNAYYLPYAMKHRMKATPDHVRAVKQAAAVDKWQWGEAVHGLQLAVIVKDVTASRTPANARVANILLAMRNTAKESMFVNVYPNDRVFDCAVLGADGSRARSALTRSDTELSFDPSRHVERIDPGRVVFVRPGRLGWLGMECNIVARPGVCRLKVAYKNGRRSSGIGNRDLWLGRAESGWVPIPFPAPADGSKSEKVLP